MQDTLPTPPVIIRHALDADYDELCPLFAGLDALHRAARPNFFRAAEGPPRTRDYVAKLTAGPDSAILVAESAGHLVGFATLILRQNNGLPVVVPRRCVEVDNLFVDAHHRRAGIGRALLTRARAWASAKYAGTIEIAVHEFNQDALCFYKAMGYETSTRRVLQRIA
jgi:GNAT superfamily N-acetyltransferase